MFTGLIQDVGVVEGVTTSAGESQITVSTKLTDFELGESVAVNGACLSVTGFTPNSFKVFASSETLNRTGLSSLKSGSRVNLERALKLGERLGGHLVAGHVDCRSKLLEKVPSGSAHKLTFSLPANPEHAKQIASKGSVAIDGVSLTVNLVHKARFDLMIIPITLKETTLGRIKPGTMINLETDVLAKYVARMLNHKDESAGGIDLDLLARSGFTR